MYAVSTNLTPQDMEVICWSRDIDYLPIAFLDLLPQSWIHLRDEKRIIITHLQE